MPRPLRYFDARTAPRADILRAVNEDGACVVTNIITAAQADAIVAEMRPFIELTGTGMDSFSGANTTRTGGLAGRSRSFCDAVLRNPILRAVADEVLLPWCKRYQAMATQVIRIGPNSRAQPWHRDRQAWGKDLVGERPTEAETCYAVMPKGSALIYTGSVIQAGGANVTKDKWRVGMSVAFACGWLRQEENQYLSVPPEIARTLHPDVQELLGYAMGDYAQGYYSPPTLEAVRAARHLVKGHESGPFGNDKLAGEISLGRSPRPWGQTAGVKKDEGILNEATIEVVEEQWKKEDAAKAEARL
ncbi:hypothetical protein DFJ74DRAFT_775418 [Hyaloraphidium curvatum]|nr:hypothetical protein DFJ74DRAFT_775418 [Hyaloraphidium curvatum]